MLYNINNLNSTIVSWLGGLLVEVDCMLLRSYISATLSFYLINYL